MKKGKLVKLLLVFSIGLSIFLVGFCLLKFNLEGKLSKVEKTNEVSKYGQTRISKNYYSNWKVYVNDRFGYLIKFPDQWREQPVAANNDGRVLYQDEFGNKISVYGTSIPSNFSIQEDPLEKSTFSLNNSDDATLIKGYLEGKSVYIVFITKNEEQYVFYAQGSSIFIKENKEILQRTAKTLDPINLIENTNIMDGF